MIYHPDDAADGYYPSHVAIRRAFAEGKLPTWERGAWSGWPLIADPYYGAFYPLNVLFDVGANAPVRGLGFSIALHTLLASLGMFVLLRRRKLAHGPALFGAIAFGLSSFMAERVRHIIFAQLMGWLPWIFVGIEGFLATRRRRELVLTAVSIGMALLCGALPLLLFVLMILAAYTIPRLGSVPPGERLRIFLLLTLAGIIGVLLAMPQIAPTLAHLPYAPRALGADYSFASSYAWPDWRYLGTLIAPDVLGGEERAVWYGKFNHWEMAGFYSGALAVMLAPLGIQKRRPETWALAALCLVGILLSLGDTGALHPFFFRHLPLYAALRCPTRALIMNLFAVPILSAEAIAKITFEPSRRSRVVGIAIAGGLSIAGLVAFWILRRPIRIEPGILATRFAFAQLGLVAAAGFGVLALFFARTLASFRPSHAFVFLLLLSGVSIYDLTVESRGILQPKPADFASGTEQFAAVDWVRAELAKSGAGNDRFITGASGPFRLNNIGMTLGMESAGGYDSVSVWRYTNLLWIINRGQPYPFKELKDDLAAGVIRRFNSPLVDLLNLRYAIMPANEPPAPDWPLRYRLPDKEPVHAKYEASWDRRLAVFENPHPMPRAFVVFEARVLPAEPLQAKAMVTLDPRKQVILDRPADPKPLGAPHALSPAKIVSVERDRVVIDADIDAPGVLVLSETTYPGWSASVDGKLAPLLIADYAFRGVALTAGRHRVEMRFHSRPTEIGLVAGLLGLVFLLMLSGVGRRPRPVL